MARLGTLMGTGVSSREIDRNSSLNRQGGQQLCLVLEVLLGTHLARLKWSQNFEKDCTHTLRLYKGGGGMGIFGFGAIGGEVPPSPK